MTPSMLSLMRKLQRTADIDTHVRRTLLALGAAGIIVRALLVLVALLFVGVASLRQHVLVMLAVPVALIVVCGTVLSVAAVAGAALWEVRWTLLYDAVRELAAFDTLLCVLALAIALVYRVWAFEIVADGAVWSSYAAALVRGDAEAERVRAEGLTVQAAAMITVYLAVALLALDAATAYYAAAARYMAGFASMG